MLVTVTIAICVLGSPVLSCYMYTCTIITFLRYLFDLRATRLSINLMSITCSIFVHYAYYTPWKMWKTFNGADKKKLLTFHLCVWFGVVGAFGVGLPLTFAFLFCKRVFRFSSYGGGRTEGSGMLLSESTNVDKPRPNKAQKRPRKMFVQVVEVVNHHPNVDVRVN